MKNRIRLRRTVTSAHLFISNDKLKVFIKYEFTSLDLQSGRFGLCNEHQKLKHNNPTKVSY